MIFFLRSCKEITMYFKIAIKWLIIFHKIKIRYFKSIRCKQKIKDKWRNSKKLPKDWRKIPQQWQDGCKNIEWVGYQNYWQSKKLREKNPKLMMQRSWHWKAWKYYSSTSTTSFSWTQSHRKAVAISQKIPEKWTFFFFTRFTRSHTTIVRAINI